MTAKSTESSPQKSAIDRNLRVIEWDGVNMSMFDKAGDMIVVESRVKKPKPAAWRKTEERVTQAVHATAPVVWTAGHIAGEVVLWGMVAFGQLAWWLISFSFCLMVGIVQAVFSFSPPPRSREYKEERKDRNINITINNNINIR